MFDLQKINLNIEESEKIGIIGYSGAGKATLIKLLREFLTPKIGTIKIGDQHLNRIAPQFLAINIAEVSRGSLFFTARFEALQIHLY